MIMKKNILVVDDSALMRRVICDIINSDDTFQVTDVCRDGLEAYEKLKVNRYDGVILDVNMPRMGGLELLERLQKERIKTNVIMVSTMTTRDADVTILAMERGAVDFVTKPTNIIEAKGDAFRKEILGILNAVLKTERINLTEQWQLSVLCRNAMHRQKQGLRIKLLHLHVLPVDQKLCRVSFLICRPIWMPQWFLCSICLPDLRIPWQTVWMRSVRSM